MIARIFGLVGYIAGIALALHYIDAAPLWQWVIAIGFAGPFTAALTSFVGASLDIALDR